MHQDHAYRWALCIANTTPHFVKLMQETATPLLDIVSPKKFLWPAFSREIQYPLAASVMQSVWQRAISFLIGKRGQLWLASAIRCAH